MTSTPDFIHSNWHKALTDRKVSLVSMLGAYGTPKETIDICSFYVHTTRRLET